MSSPDDLGYSSRSRKNSWLLQPQMRSSTLLAALFLAASVTCTKATNAWAVAGSVADHKEQRRREVPRSRRASSARGLKSSRGGVLPAFVGCALLKPRWNLGQRGHRHLGVGTTRKRPLSSVAHSNHNGMPARPRMDFGELDGIMQTMLSPASESTSTGVSLDPAQEDVVLLDLETPAILLTAGAGTGKTHTLAARLARILGVEPRRPTELSVEKQSAVLAGAGADVEQLDRLHDFGEEGAGQGGKSGGGWWDRRVAAHAAAPESVLVLSFTNQAAQDVRERAIAVGVPRAQADRVWAATFHSFALTVLKQNRRLVWADSSSSMDSRHASGLDIIGHTEQVSLMARILDDQDEDCDSDDDFAAPSYGGEKAFESSWLPTSDGRSWGMPPTDEERGREAARRRKESETRAKTVLSRITMWKEKGITVQDVRLRNVELDDYTDTAAAFVYASYQHHLHNRRQVDYGDLCMMATELFTRHPEVLERYRWRLRHILVDEYQDTSPAQQRLLKALVSGLPSTRSAARGTSTSTSTPTADSPNSPTKIGDEDMGEGGGAGAGLETYPGLGVSLFCAGDEDQHIYGWRGTTVDHLHRFEEDFPGAVRCALTETHRLPVHLLRSATGLMRAGGLVPLLNRRMRTKQHTAGAIVRAQGLWNSREEGKWVAVEACKMNREQGISYKDMAVIARTAYNTRELEESLAARGVPYTVEGGSSFFSRPEVQAPLALLALCANPQDDAAFRRFISLRSRTSMLEWATPSTMRGVGELAVADGVSYAEGVRISVSRGQVAGKDASKFIHDLRRWSSLLMGWPKLHETERGAIVWRIFWEAGFLPRPVDASFSFMGGVGGGAVGGSKMTKDEETVGQMATAASRCDHIARFLLRATRAREEAADQQAARKDRRGRGGRWEGITGDQNEQNSRSCEDSLEMMTMHQAKGREFKVVFLTGWDEGSFPFLPNSGDGDHVVESLERLHEERRLGYVALTRASENAIITFSKKRRFKNNWVNSTGPSRFLLEMPTEYVEVLPDAIGRTLNDYPGLAGSHRLAFDGLIQAGKIRRSRPVLPSAAERSKVDSSSHDTPSADDDKGLPPGCAIANRNPNAAFAEFSTAGRVSDADAATTRKGTAKPLVAVAEPGMAAVENAGVGVVATGTRQSPVVDGPAAANPSGVYKTQRRLTVGDSSRGSAEKPSAVAPRSKAAPAEIGATPISRPRQAEGTTEIPPSVPPLPSPREMITEAVRYNPGPTFRKTRGRKKKALLDPSEITKDGVVGTKELNALLKDPTLQQASLKNYLRAVLAIQHGCVRGSIPVWGPAGGVKSSKSANSAEPSLRKGLVESEATGRAALSTCSAQDLASYTVVLLDTRRKKR